MVEVIPADCLCYMGTHQLVEVLPVVLHHQTERVEHGPTETVETGVPVIRVRSVALQARVVGRARSGPNNATFIHLQGTETLPTHQ